MSRLLGLAFDRVNALPHAPLLVAAGLVLGAMAIAFRSQAEPYTFDHIELNRRKEETGRPKTEWMNMGYWRETDVFPDACQALARKVLDAADLRHGGHHLDVAHGSGDSLLLVQTHVGQAAYPPQRSITGITSLSAHFERAKDRMTAADAAATGIRLVCDDAIFRPTSASGATHPFAPGSKTRYTSIICLDAAYHFVTRHLFLSQAFDALAPGGTLALGDILSSPSYPNTASTAWSFTAAEHTPIEPSAVSRILMPRLLPLLSVPAVNIVPLPALAQQLLDLGFEDVAIEDVSDHVWPGFAAFLCQRGLFWRLAGQTIKWLGGSGGLRWVIVRARKPIER